MSKNLLYAQSIPINEQISIAVPTVGEIITHENEYYSGVSALIASPADYMVQLDDIGVDFSTLKPFDLFVILFKSFDESNFHLFFRDLNPTKFEMAVNMESGEVVLEDKDNGIIIDRGIHTHIRQILGDINNFEIKDKQPGNEAARKYMIERARIKQQRAKRRKQPSHLEDLIISMVNTDQYKYNYDETQGLTIYQFNRSVRQVIKKINYDNTMIGCYAGTVKMSELSKEQLNWLSSN